MRIWELKLASKFLDSLRDDIFPLLWFSIRPAQCCQVKVFFIWYCQHSLRNKSCYACQFSLVLLWEFFLLLSVLHSKRLAMNLSHLLRRQCVVGGLVPLLFRVVVCGWASFHFNYWHYGQTEPLHTFWCVSVSSENWEIRGNGGGWLSPAAHLTLTDCTRTRGMYIHEDASLSWCIDAVRERDTWKCWISTQLKEPMYIY